MFGLMYKRLLHKASRVSFKFTRTSRISANMPHLWARLQQEMRFRAYEYYIGLTRNPEWFFMRRVARFKLVRLVSHELRRRHHRCFDSLTKSAATVSVIDDVCPAVIVNTLETVGLFRGLQLPVATVQAIRTYAETTPCYVNGKPSLGFFYRQRAQAQQQCQQPILVGNYFNVDQDCQAICQLKADPTLLAIAAAYLQAEPAYLSSRLWWSFPEQSSQSQRCQVSQAFHYDLDSYRFLKFFFYLTDVDEASGPHICVMGSHEQMQWKHRLLRKRYTDEQIVKAYGAKSIATLCGPAGYGFVEDTFCFHKGAVPTSRDRLLLLIEYGTKDYGMEHQRRPAADLALLPGQCLYSPINAAAS